MVSFEPKQPSFPCLTLTRNAQHEQPEEEQREPQQEGAGSVATPEEDVEAEALLEELLDMTTRPVIR